MAGDGIRMQNFAEVAIFQPAVFETRHNVRDCYDVTCKPGQLVKTWKKDYIKYRGDGSIRNVRQWPGLRDGATGHNLVTTLGVNSVLDVYLDNQTQIAVWNVGLTDDTPSPAAGDTGASHGGWTEFTEYTETALQTWTGGTAAAGSIDNSSNTADFSINSDTNGGLGGVFLSDTTTKPMVGGLLYSCVALTGGNRVVGNGDTVQVTYTFTAADDAV